MARNALVTGVGRRAGIGFAIVRRLLEDGASVFAHGWSPHDARQPWGADEGAADGSAFPRSKRTSPIRTHPHASSRPRGRPSDQLDMLVVNHARSGDGALAELTADHLDDFLHENVRASLLLVKEFAAQHDGGRRPRRADDLGAAHRADGEGGRLRRLEGRARGRDLDARRGADRPRDHREHASIPARPTPAGARRRGSCRPHAARALGRARRRRAPRSRGSAATTAPGSPAR